MLNVVEAYQRHVFGHRYATLAQRLHSADCGHVVGRENCRQQRGEAKNLLRCAIPAYLIDGRAKHQVLAVGNTGGGQRFSIALMPFATRGSVINVGVVRDVAMTYDDEMLDKPARAGNAVTGDEITIEIGKARSNKTSGNRRRKSGNTLCRDSSLAGAKRSPSTRCATISSI